MNRRFTQVALAAAAAMTISLASPVAASADESASATLSTESAASAPTRTPSAITRNPAATPSITTLQVRPGVLSTYGTTTYLRSAAINYNIPDGWSSIPTAHLTKGGRTTGISLYDGTYASVPTAWGSGVYTISKVTFRKYDGTATYTAPNAVSFRVRQPMHYRAGLQIKRRGSKLTFNVRKLRSYNGARYVKVQHKVKVQVKKGKKWKTLRNVKVNKKGNKSFSLRHGGKRKYRLFVPTTAKVQGGKTAAIRI